MNKYVLSAGGIAGLLTILLLFGLYLVEPRTMLNPFPFWGSLLFYILAMLGAALLEKRKNEGVLSLKLAVRSAFSTFLIANLIFFAFYYFMFARFDPQLTEIQRELTKEFYEGYYSGSELRKNLKLLEESDFTVTLSTVISGYVKGAIGGFLLSVLIAFLVREEA